MAGLTSSDRRPDDGSRPSISADEELLDAGMAGSVYRTTETPEMRGRGFGLAAGGEAAVCRGRSQPHHGRSSPAHTRTRAVSVLPAPVAGVVHLDGPRNSGLQQRQVEGSVAGRRVVVLGNLTRTRSSVIDAARIIGSEVGTISGAMTVVGPGKGPARFRVSTLCTDAALEAEGRRQGSVLPPHLDGSPGAADPVPPLGGFDLSK